MKLTDDWRKVTERLVEKIESAVYPAPSAVERGEKFKVLSKMLMVSPTADRVRGEHGGEGVGLSG